MKYHLFLLISLPFTLFSQKRVDLDRFNFRVQFRSLPLIRIDSSYRTYNVAVDGTKMMRPFLKEIDPSNSVILDGWRKLPQDGHLNIEVKLEDLLPETVTLKDRVINVKDSKGVITKTSTLFYQEVIYTFAATAEITDYLGVHILDEVLADRAYKQVYTSPEFGNRALAESYFVINSLKVTKDLYRSCVNRAIHYLSERITSNFGFSEVSVQDYMWVIGGKKDPEYSDCRKAFLLMNDVLFSMDANNSIAGVREQLKPAIDYFENIKKRYDSADRHDRKIRYASYFNLAVLYYYLDDPEMMMNEANGLILNDFQTGIGKSFQETALRLKKQFQNTNIYTRHFRIEISNFRGPKERPDTVIK